MNANVRIEEIAPLGDFVKTSYTRDFAVIENRFPKLDTGFRTGFESQLALIKTLESSLVLTEEQKGVTASLYEEADELNSDLNFLKSYIGDAGLNAKVIEPLKSYLHNGNIEGALLKIEGVKQFVLAHEAALEEHGMAPGFATVLDNYKVSMTTKNTTQNAIMNSRKELTDANITQYDALLKIIRTICSKGKLVFKDTVYEDEYVMSKVVKRMRAVKD